MPSGVRPVAARVAALAPYRFASLRTGQRSSSACSYSSKRLQCHAVAAPDAPSAVNSKPLVAPGQGQQQVGPWSTRPWGLGPAGTAKWVPGGPPHPPTTSWLCAARPAVCCVPQLSLRSLTHTAACFELCTHCRSPSCTRCEGSWAGLGIDSLRRAAAVGHGYQLELGHVRCLTSVFMHCFSSQFGGSSVASAERMMEVADIVCSFPEHLPCVVLSAMGKASRQIASGCCRCSSILCVVHRPANCARAPSPIRRDCYCSTHMPMHGALSAAYHPPPLPPCSGPAMAQTTNLLLQAGDEALRTPPGDISSLAPLRCGHSNGAPPGRQARLRHDS